MFHGRTRLGPGGSSVEQDVFMFICVPLAGQQKGKIASVVHCREEHIGASGALG